METDINPADGSALAACAMHDRRELDGIPDSASEAFPEWRNTPFAARAELIRAAGRVLSGRRDVA